MTTNKYLPGITRDELKTIIKELGEPSYRANQIAEHIYRHRVTDPDKMSNLPQNLRGKLKELFFPFPVTVEECIAAGDQTKKLLLKLHDGNQIEMVMIPTAERMTFCLSTQAGCPVGCRFCASGAAGLARNLSAAEILAELFAGALLELGVRRAMVVHGLDGLDEISCCAATRVSELRDGRIVTRELLPELLLGTVYAPEELRGGDPERNAEILRSVLSGVDRGTPRAAVLLNAGAAIYVAGVASTLEEGILLAGRSIDSGAAERKLELLIEASHGTGA